MKSKATYGLPERRFEMAYVTVPKDLTKIKSKVMFNLTKRQLLCFGAAVAIGLPLFFLTKDSAGTTTVYLSIENCATFQLKIAPLKKGCYSSLYVE